MRKEEFIFWLKGYLEAKKSGLNSSEIETITKKIEEVEFEPKKMPVYRNGR